MQLLRLSPLGQWNTVHKILESAPQTEEMVGERPSWEVFYACPSATAVAFFEAAAELAPPADLGTPALQQLAALSELAAAVQVSGACAWTMHIGYTSLGQGANLKAPSRARYCQEIVYCGDVGGHSSLCMHVAGVLWRVYRHWALPLMLTLEHSDDVSPDSSHIFAPQLCSIPVWVRRS